MTRNHFFHYEMEESKPSQILSDWNRWVNAGASCPYMIELTPGVHDSEIERYGSLVNLSTLRQGKTFSSPAEVETFIRDYFLAKMKDEELKIQLFPSIFQNIHQGGITHANNLSLQSMMGSKGFKYRLSEPLQKIKIIPTADGFNSIEENVYCRMVNTKSGKSEAARSPAQPYATTRAHMHFDKTGFTMTAFEETHDKKVNEIFKPRNLGLLKYLCGSRLPELPRETMHFPVSRSK